jgi:hypothetical protein
MLTLGLPKREIVMQLKQKHDIGRTKAYDKVQQAAAYHTATEWDSPGACHDDVQQILTMTKALLVTAYETGDAKAFCTLSRSYQSTSAIVGLLPADSAEKQYFFELCDDTDQDNNEDD